MKPDTRLSALLLILTLSAPLGIAAEAIPAAGSLLAPASLKEINAGDVTAERVGSTIPVTAIGEPVNAVTLAPPRWVEASANMPAHAVVDGSMAPVDPNAKPINFRVILPASWSRRAAQFGGGGLNGMIPNLASAEYLRHGFATYGSDSGHQMAWNRRDAQGAGAVARDDWALNDEVARNLGFMQMKKTHDAAMVIIERVYGERPRFNYFFGSSQGGREALTVAQRYPRDYDGVSANVPVLSLSTLMLAPALVQIRQVPLAACHASEP
jgi:feruloyl esterase